jgi:hypothetical protein
MKSDQEKFEWLGSRGVQSSKRGRRLLEKERTWPTIG